MTDQESTRLSERPTWQPIESAPKDWSSVLLADEDGNVCEGYYSHADGGDDCWYRANTCRLDDDSVLTPVYWMPLPEAPAEIAIRLYPLLLGEGGIRLGAALPRLQTPAPTCATCKFRLKTDNMVDPECTADVDVIGGRIVNDRFGCIFHQPAARQEDDPAQHQTGAAPTQQDRPWDWGDWRPCAEHPHAEHELVCFACNPMLSPEEAAASEAHAPTVTTNGQQTGGTDIKWDAALTAEPERLTLEEWEAKALNTSFMRKIGEQAELLREKDAEIARLRDAAAVFAAPTCQHCGLPLTCSSGRAERIHGLEKGDPNE